MTHNKGPEEDDKEMPNNPLESEVGTLGTLTGITDFEDCDSAIISNGFSQLMAGFGMLFVYLACRKRTPWVYYPNIKNKPQHPCYQPNPGILSWIPPLLAAKDTQLLSMVGLDGFMLLQLLKMLYRMCFILSLVVVPILCRLFYTTKSKHTKKQLFVLLSIADVRDPRVYWTVLVLSYISTFVIFYLVFIYYKRFTTLRQLYLAAPATMTSINQLKKISTELGSDENAIDHINVLSRTVLIDRLPAEIHNDEELMEYIKSLQVGEIECVALIHDTYFLQKLYEQRDEVIQDIEKEIAVAFSRILNFYKSEEASCKASFGDLYASDLDKSALNLFEHTNFTLEEKVRIFNHFCKYADKFLAKTLLRETMVDVHLNRLREVTTAILNEKKRLQEDSNDGKAPISTPSASDTLYVDADAKHDVSFFSISQILSFNDNKDLFTLELPLYRNKAFITFKDQRSAGILRQTKLGSRVFSSNVEQAPAPHDVLWRNICRPEVSGYFFNLFSLGLYILFNLFFLFIAVKIIESLQIEKNTNNYLFKILFRSSFVYSLYRGILAPLIYNILLFFVPIIIKLLLHLEDTSSYSGLQAKLMSRFSLFLFCNAFLATVITSCALGLYNNIGDSQMGLSSILSQLKDSILTSSVFFFNTIVQRLCVGTMIVVLKPSPFLYNWLLAPFVIYTRRQRIEREFSPPIDFGNHIPNLLLILPMALTYSCICPLLLVMSCIFYFFSYFVYKNELLYASRNDYESGGLHWKPCVKFILFTLVAFQITTATFIFSIGMSSIFYSFLPLIFFTIVFSNGLNTLFEKSSENFPMNAPEEKFLDRFAKKSLEERHRILNEWNVLKENLDEDTLEISELGFVDEQSTLTTSLYKDPSTRVSVGSLILPENFFKIVHFLKSFDKDNLTGFKP